MMPVPAHTLLIVLLAFWTPVWCCGMFTAKASAADPVEGMPAHVESTPRAGSCEMTAEAVEDEDCGPGQNDKSSCECELMAGAALVDSKVHQTHNAAGAAPTLLLPVAILPPDPAPATAIHPFSEPRGGSPPVAARTLLAHICVLTI